MTADEVIQRLRAGNERFINNRPEHPHLDPDRRMRTALEGQNPYACVLACSDSRVPVELLFDAGIGDLFTVEVAGNVCGLDVTGSIEFAVGELNIPLVLVLGHTHCGAVTAAVDGVPATGALETVLERVRPAVVIARTRHPDAGREQLIARATEGNVHRSLTDLVTASSPVRDALREGRLRVAGAVYDIGTGAVTWLEEPAELRDWIDLDR
ncbi:MAG: Carbonic anhydrase 2 [Calditrichaeota bacterium]|nr:Carbonic anhydrase 2 [Calditrichota bacterium]